MSRNKYKNKRLNAEAKSQEQVTSEKPVANAEIAASTQDAEKSASTATSQGGGVINTKNSGYGKAVKTNATATASSVKPNFFQRHKILIILAVIILAAAVITVALVNRNDNNIGSTGASGKYTLIELGSENCYYCEKLLPVMDDLRAEYGDTISIEYYDVYKTSEGADLARKYNVSVTPTLVFLDKSGNLVERKEGYFSQSAFEDIFYNLGWL